jgi:DNA-binding LacI/PurR family transcriptional regulator
VKTPRLADVAAQAGVSQATVSRVLNDRPGVSVATKRAVMQAIDMLGYDRSSRLRRAAGLAGLVIPELNNPIFPAFAQVIGVQLSQSGYTPVLCTQSPGGIHEDEYVQMLFDREVSGIIYLSGQHADTTCDPRRYAAQRAAGMPLAFINGALSGLDAAFISNDDVAGMNMAVSHLVGLGHERIGLAVGQARYSPSIRKVAGFRQAIAQHLGITEVEDLIVQTFYSLEGGQNAAVTLLKAGCTAIACGSDLMALGVIAQVRRQGLEVPRDISVIGFDDSLLMDFTEPPMTTVRANVTAMGEAAVRALLQGIAGEPVSSTEVLFRPELTVRGSTSTMRPRSGRSIQRVE